MVLVPAELAVVRQLLVGETLDEKLVVVEEPLPGRVTEARRADEEYPLSPLAVVADDLAGRIGLPEPDPVGDHHAAVFG